MLRFPFNSASLAVAIIVAASMAACSGGRSLLPGTAPISSIEARKPEPGSIQHAAAPPTSMQLAWLMTDGTVLTQSASSWNEFYRYAPDENGTYADGTWTQVGSLQSGYAPDAGASDVLANGDLALIGGEYNYDAGAPSQQYELQLTNKAAIYDPVKETWTPLGHPTHWQWIGDSPSSVLPDGRLLLGDKLHKWDAYLDPKTLKWVHTGDKGKADFNAEEGWTLLPNGTILTADVKDGPNTEIYDPSKGSWSSAGSTPVLLSSKSPYHKCIPYGPKPKDCYLPPGEIGPAILRPDGTVFATGSGEAGSGGGDGNTAIYNSGSASWSTGPKFPDNDNAGDNFGILEPNGDVLVFGDSGNVYEFNGSTLVEVPKLSGTGPPILLPTGQIAIFGSSSVTIFTPNGSPKSNWAPTITKAPSTITAGKTYEVFGTQFNGLSQAMAFGDEYQNATNYPLVRIAMNASGHVFYARTHDHSTMGVATGSKKVWTYFDVPSGIASGAGTLEVVANGIASAPVNVTVSASRHGK